MNLLSFNFSKVAHLEIGGQYACVAYMSKAPQEVGANPITSNPNLFWYSLFSSQIFSTRPPRRVFFNAVKRGGKVSRERSPNRDKAFEIYQQHGGQIQNREIAKMLDISEKSVSGWKTKDKWTSKLNGVLQSDERSTPKAKKNSKKKKERITKVDKEDITNPDLPEKQWLFCLYYTQLFNATKAYQRAYKCNYETALRCGSRLLKKVDVISTIKELKKQRLSESLLTEEDILQSYIDIAFANINDYVDVTLKERELEDGSITNYNVVRIKPSVEMDGRIVTQISQGKDGITVKLADKMRALDFLAKNMGMLSADIKERLALEREKFELSKPKDDEVIEEAPFTLPANVIAPPFISLNYSIDDHEYLEYVLTGGRGSTKSTYISEKVIELIAKNRDLNAVAMRQVANTLRDSVYAQFLWSIDKLELNEKFKCSYSPLEITYIPTGQKIFFRGADDPVKLKGIKVVKGYVGILWLEELDQFKGAESVRTIQQSVIRGGDIAYIFKSFNPPKTKNNWANKDLEVPKANRLVVHSNYTQIPKSWLGEAFIEEAEFLKEVNPAAYEHEYMGIPNGNGGNVFDNVVIREITDDEIKTFDRIYCGVDWGWFPDPWAFTKMYYNVSQRKLYIFDEARANKKSNRDTYEILVEKKGIKPNDRITCDSAENKSIQDYKDYGLFARGAIKGPGSVEYSMKWLQSLTEIVIDNARCPYTAAEFLDYEYERDKDGNVISGYPDENNHQIDSVRYAMEEVWKRRGQ